MLDFPSWFTGMFGADGCFSIAIKKRKQWRNWQATAEIELRDDDVEILYKIRDFFHMGNVYFRKVQQHREYLSNPRARWSVQSKKDCMRLVRHFDKYPLQSKKAKDYKIWRAVVIEWQKPWRAQNDQYLLGLKKQLNDIKRYNGNPGAIVPPTDLQPPLFEIS